MNIVYVALGGMFGALARYGMGHLIVTRWNTIFPLGTLMINIIGSFALGVLNVLVLEKLLLAPEWRLGVGVGFLGAFTTFSAFTYETMLLLDEGKFGVAFGYVSASVLLGLGAAILGVYAARSI